jgi:hypothetical protein
MALFWEPSDREVQKKTKLRKCPLRHFQEQFGHTKQWVRTLLVDPELGGHRKNGSDYKSALQLVLRVLPADNKDDKNFVHQQTDCSLKDVQKAVYSLYHAEVVRRIVHARVVSFGEGTKDARMLATIEQNRALHHRQTRMRTETLPTRKEELEFGMYVDFDYRYIKANDMAIRVEGSTLKGSPCFALENVGRRSGGNVRNMVGSDQERSSGLDVFVH